LRLVQSRLRCQSLKKVHDAQIAALKALKLNIRRAKVKTKGSTKVNKFFITDAHTAEKIMKVLPSHFPIWLSLVIEHQYSVS